MSQIICQTRKSTRFTPRASWWRAAALSAAFAVMGGICAAQAPADEAVASLSLDALARTRKHVQEYFERFSDLTCKESVTQLVLNESGRTIYRETSAYDYQLQTSEQNGTWKFNETRESRNPAFRDPARTLLVTTGFASLLLVAHPMYEASYVFEPDGSEAIGGVSYLKIRFKPVPGGSSPASLRLRGRNYPLPLSGTFWIEPQSGAVVKLEATVDSGLSDVGLAGMHSEVQFALHQFHDKAEAVWVPDSAIIDVETPHQHWRNLHRFTAYKRFDVNVHEEIGQNQ
jgi:hypothetical protein